jgi:hypothetical protein
MRTAVVMAVLCILISAAVGSAETDTGTKAAPTDFLRRGFNQDLLAEEIDAEGDTMAFWGASGRDNQNNVPFEFYAANTVALGAVLHRIEFNPDYVNPIPDPGSSYPDGVKFSLTERSAEFGTSENGFAFARCPEPGVLVFGMWITSFSGPYPLILPGSGPIIEVPFNVDVPPPPLMKFVPVRFVDELPYWRNSWSDEYGTLIIPTLVDGEFEVLKRPSCPVLFSYDGTRFNEENTLLTACEPSGYTEVVSDYYRVTGPVASDDGTITFQLREMEDEITYLHDVRLITVDHAPGTRVACTVDGRIFAYDGYARPLSAVSDEGVDVLSSIASEDGKLFTAKKSGHIDLELPIEEQVIDIPSLSKRVCDDLLLTAQAEGQKSIPPASLDVERLAADGTWVPLATLPSREKTAHEYVFIDRPVDAESDRMKIRISWEGSYTTDVIRQFVPSNEAPIISEFRASYIDPMTNVAAQPNEEGLFVLRKGDILELDFSTEPGARADAVRDYIVVAKGNYTPDYGIGRDAGPATVALHDNYPNPFNPTTTISFTVPHTTRYELSIYTVAGQVVSTFTGTAEPGMVRIAWDASGLASGVYFYKLTAGSYTSTKKMILLR